MGGIIADICNTMIRMAKEKGITFGDVMCWSPRCREHFFPWATKAAAVMREHAIAEAGITECHPGYGLERSAPRFHLLVYPTHGKGEVRDAYRTLTVAPGQLLLAPARRPFGYRPVSRRWRFVWFHLPDDELWGHLAKSAMVVRKTLLTEAVSRASDGFLEESRGRTPSHEQASAHFIKLIEIYIQRELGAADLNAHGDTGNRLDHLCAIINADLAKPWDVDTLAKVIEVSPPHLFHLVNKRFGVSPMKLVTRLRMERAQEWLLIHDVPQRVIGEMVGYTNEFAFLVAFKRFSGVTPREFRKRR